MPDIEKPNVVVRAFDALDGYLEKTDSIGGFKARMAFLTVAIPFFFLIALTGIGIVVGIITIVLHYPIALFGVLGIAVAWLIFNAVRFI